ncbi:LOW QUALITY PROTEIN: Membrane-spanning 4-domains subfamily A member 18, partial [Galemys pyrenaicus]
ELSAMAKQETLTKGVPGTVAPETMHVAQSGSALASGSHRQPLGVTAHSASGAVEYDNAGRANFQSPLLVVQGPAGAGAAQSQFRVLQPLAGGAQCSLGATDVQTLPGNPSVYTPNQSQGNTPFASFLPLDLKRLPNKETRMLGVSGLWGVAS